MQKIVRRSSTLLKWVSGRRALYLFPALLAGVLAGLFHLLGLFQIVDGIVLDRIMVRSTGDRPVVTIVELDSDVVAAELTRSSLALGARQVVFLSDPGSDLSDLGPHEVARVIVGYGVPADSAELMAANLRAWSSPVGEPARVPRVPPLAEYGIHRSSVAWVEDEDSQFPTLEAAAAGRLPPSQTFYVPIPRRLSFAVLTSQQILAGDLEPGDLERMTVLVASPTERLSDMLVTPADPSSATVSPARFSAYAIQALTTGRAATKFAPLPALLFILFTSVVAGMAGILTRRFNSAILAFTIGGAIIPVGWLVLELASRIVPFGGMLTGLLLSTLGTIMLQERRNYQRLERALVPAIEQTVSHTAFRNRDNLPSLLSATAATAGVERMLLLRPGDFQGSVPLASIKGDISDLTKESHRLIARLTSGLPSGKSVAAGELLPHWPGEVRLRAIGSQHEPLYWLYTFGDHPAASSGEFVAGSIAYSFRAMQNSHASLSAQQRGLRAVDPVDFRVVNAIELITRNGRQLRKATDQLHSSVMFFDVVGFPLYANPQMVDLLDAFGLNQQTALLPEIIDALTELNSRQAEALMRDVLRDGGEASATIQGIPGLSATLRISGPDPAVSARESVVVLEAFDTTELARLSDLRLAITEFIDVQLRNDLETIALGAALARKSEGNEKRRLRAIEKIVLATQNATQRLDAMKDLTRRVPVAHEFAAHPIQLRPIAETVAAQLVDLAASYDVEIDLELPAVSGHSVGDPYVLSKMLEALMRLVINDSPPDSRVNLSLVERETRSQIRITGGFGMTRERLTQAFDDPPRNEIPEFQIVKDSALVMAGWDADFTYECETGKGYTFDLILRRIV